MTTRRKQIALEFNEHDTLQLIGLLRREAEQADCARCSYLKQLEQKMKRELEKSYVTFPPGMISLSK